MTELKHQRPYNTKKFTTMKTICTAVSLNVINTKRSNRTFIQLTGTEHSLGLLKYVLCITTSSCVIIVLLNCNAEHEHDIQCLKFHCAM